MSFQSQHETLKLEIRTRAEQLMVADNLLMQTLRARFPHMSMPAVLSWTPEQSEEIFVVLIDRHHVATVEYPRAATGIEQVEIEIIPVPQYQKGGLSKDVRRALKAGLELQPPDIGDFA